MRSQALTAKIDSISGSLFDGRYVDPEEEIDIKNQTATSTGSVKSIVDYFPLPSKMIYASDERARQVGWWIGHVESVYDDYFTATLEDLQGRISVAEFDKEELTPTELSLLVPNCRFTFSVTQVDKHSGREYVSKISLSGQPVWTEIDDEKFKESYEKIFPEELFDF